MPESQEIRASFHAELEEVMVGITRLAARVTEMLPGGTEALLSNDLALAQTIIDSDDVIDDLAVQLEERCYGILALQAPVAGDLRAIITAIRLVAEIERSADLVVNICKAGRRIYPSTFPPAIRGLLSGMNDEAVNLFRLCMDAYADRDSSLAAALDDIDDRLDELHSDFISAVLTWGGDGDVQAAVQLALIGRYYERIGDHAVNIGERVRYMVDGWLPEHTGSARVQAATPVWNEP